MFDISWGELMLIGAVALIVIGPKELPTVLRTVGQWVTKIRRMASEFQGQFHEAMREAELADIKQQVESIADPTKAFSDFNPLETARKDIESAFEEKPAAAAAPADAANPVLGAEPTPAALVDAPAPDRDIGPPSPVEAALPVEPEAPPARAALDGALPPAPHEPPAVATPSAPESPPATLPEVGGGRAA